MISLNNKKQEGFTVVELVIVFVIIGILLTLVVVTFTDIQQRNHNTSRENDIKSIASQLEAYNVNNGFYPTLTQMNNKPAGWVEANLKGLDPTALQDPQGSNQTLVSAPTAKAYSYHPTDDTGNACDDIKVNCTKFTLTATFEGTVSGATTYVKTNR